MHLKTGQRFGFAWLSRSMARHRRCSVYVLPNGSFSFPTSLIGPPHRGWHINITAEWVASILLSRFKVMTELSRIDFTWKDLCQHSLRLVYWIKHQKGINVFIFCLMQRLGVGCDLCQSGPARDFFLPGALSNALKKFRSKGFFFYPLLQMFRKKRGQRGKNIPDCWLIRSRKNDQYCILLHFFCCPFQTPDHYYGNAQ